MAHRIKIEGAGPHLDGEYDLELSFTHRDFRTIKQLSGIRANEVQEALAAGDLDIVVALASIGLRRAGKSHTEDELWDLQTGGITLIADEEVDTSPPPIASSESDGAVDSPKLPSGLATNTSTEPSPEISPQSDSGIPQSESGSVRVTSQT